MSPKNGAPLVSIIVPVHNTSIYLDECLCSLTAQTLREIEIICINDSSTDDSLEKLNSWKDRDDRIIVINTKENLKAGGARNLGIKAAQAEYLGFVDSDDYVSEDMYEMLIEHSNNMKADIVNSNLHIYHGTVDSPYYNIPNEEGEITHSVIIKHLAYHGLRIWTGIFKKYLFDRFQLYFPEKIYFEDNAIATPLFLIAKSIVFINNSVPSYYYRITSTTSYTKSPNKLIEKLNDRQTTAKMMLNHTKRLGVYEMYHNEVNYIFYRLFLRTTLRIHLFSGTNFNTLFCRNVYDEYLRLTTPYKMRENPYYEKNNSRFDFFIHLAGSNIGCRVLFLLIKLYKIIKK